MAQVFHRSSNTVAKASIVGGLVGFVALAASLYFFNLTYGNRVYVPIEQPVQFSHKHHVGDDGIDCRYCHTSVEKSAFAGMPSTHTCMTCHSQIWSDSPELQAVRASFISGQPIQWARVHDLPDFVYFNHSIHVKKGVACETCHGRVDQKPLMFKSHTMTMSWCLECHRNPEKFIRPRETVTLMGWEPGQRGQEESGHASEEAAGTASTEHANAEGASIQGKPNELKPLHNMPHDYTRYKEFQNQAQMGKFLVREYHVLNSRQLTDCSTCHR